MLTSTGIVRRMASLEQITEERLRVADFLEGLTDDQWSTQSCCGEWTVQQVVGHILGGPIRGVKGALGPLLKARGNTDRANDIVATQLASVGPEKLVEQLREYAESTFAPPGFGYAAVLTDLTIHGQDISRPLGVDLGVPADRWRSAIESAVSWKFAPFSSRSKLKGLSFHATDLDLTVGDGPQISGLSRDLAHVMWGRPPAIQHLSGAGAETLKQRLSF